MRFALTALAIGSMLQSAVVRAGPPANLEDEGRTWWSHVEKLGANDMEGRFTGTPGYLRAAAYVADRFKAYGLKPAGSDGFFQPVDLIGQEVLAERSSATLNSAAGSTPLAIGQDLLFVTFVQQPHRVEADLVFLGYGFHLPEVNYDDFAGEDLRGKIVVVMLSGGPANISSGLRAHAHFAELWPALARAGAVGVIAIANPKSMDIPWARQIPLSKVEGMYLADAAIRPSTIPLFAATFNPAHAEKIFERSGHSFAQILALVDAGAALPHFPLHGRLQATVATRTRPLSAPNIVALLPGADPTMAKEYVVLSAHLDHLGIAEPINGDKIYHGVMDNAAGVASILETARLMTELPRKPLRSVLFLVVTGEERGLLGSRAFAEKPTVARKALVADLNVDMFLPIFPLDAVVVYGLEESTLGSDASAAAAEMGIGALADPQPDRNLFVRSDQYSFIRTGVPALAFKNSALPGTAAASAEKAWLAQRYHAPADDLNQPVDKSAAARFDRYLAELALRVADEPARPQWLPTSFFRRFAPAASTAQ